MSEKIIFGKLQKSSEKNPEIRAPYQPTTQHDQGLGISNLLKDTLKTGISDIATIFSSRKPKSLAEQFSRAIMKGTIAVAVVGVTVGVGSYVIRHHGDNFLPNVLNFKFDAK